MEKIRLGFIGVGRVFRLGYLSWFKNYLNEHNYIELTALSEVRENLGIKYAKMFNCEYYKDTKELLKSKKVDAVIINTPNWLHEEQVIDAAEKGVHILCEKPMAPTTSACDRMISACNKNNVLLFISFMRRFNFGFQKIREIVKNNEIGNLIEININWPYFIPDLDKRPYKEVIEFINKNFKINLLEMYGAWRLKDKLSGGGDFLDHGPHIIDFLRWIAGDIKYVSGNSRVLVEGRNEDYTKCLLKFKSGVIGSITTTLYCFKSGLVGKVYGFIRGTKGCIEFTLPNVDKFKPIRYLKLYKESDSNLGRVIRGLGLLKCRKIKLSRNNVFEDQLDYFITTLLGIRKPHPVFGKEDFAATGEDGRYTINIVELCYKSSELNSEWLEVK